MSSECGRGISKGKVTSDKLNDVYHTQSEKNGFYGVEKDGRRQTQKEFWLGTEYMPVIPALWEIEQEALQFEFHQRNLVRLSQNE